jgi:hypothetical protein
MTIIATGAFSLHITPPMTKTRNLNANELLALDLARARHRCNKPLTPLVLLSNLDAWGFSCACGVAILITSEELSRDAAVKSAS